MRRRDTWLFGFLLIFCALFAHGQSFGPYAITGTGCTPPIDVTQKGSVAYQITGATWTGTIQPKVSIAGQAAGNAPATAPTATSAQPITVNGAYFTNVSGYQKFLLCGATVTNTATIYVNVSTASH